MIGKVKWFNDELGYGFITANDVEEDIFFHFSEIKMDGYKKLTKNDIVQFTFDKEKLKATNIEIIIKSNKKAF